jgi:hypothetical protein
MGSPELKFCGMLQFDVGFLWPAQTHIELLYRYQPELIDEERKVKCKKNQNLMCLSS